MPSYTIYEKPGLPVDEAIESAVLVKNHFSVLAFILPALWMLVKRLWWVLLIYIVVLIPVSLVEVMLPVWASMLLTLLMSLWISLEAPNLIGWSLRRKGYVEVASLYAEDRDHCEHRYIEARLSAANATKTPEKQSFPLQNSLKSGYVATNDIMRETGTKEPIIGLFPAPDRSREI